MCVSERKLITVCMVCARARACVRERAPGADSFGLCSTHVFVSSTNLTSSYDLKKYAIKRYDMFGPEQTNLCTCILLHTQVHVSIWPLLKPYST